jgi:hypothetical protein
MNKVHEISVLFFTLSNANVLQRFCAASSVMSYMKSREQTRGIVDPFSKLQDKWSNGKMKLNRF